MRPKGMLCDDTCCVKVANRVWRPRPSTVICRLLRNALHPRENTRDTAPCQNPCAYTSL